MATVLEPVFPNITRWVNDHGIVEIGYDPNTDSFVRALDEGAGVWTGKPRYETLDDALMDLEEGIKAALKSRKSRKRRAPGAAETAKKPDRRKTKPSEEGVPKQVQKLEEIAEAIRRSKHAEITRLTVVKKLCEDHEAARTYALFLARKAQARLREKRGDRRYVPLANRAIREMKSAPDQLTENYDGPLLGLLRDIEHEQNEYKSSRWGVVRSIKSWDLLIVEKALRAFIRAYEAPYWLYQATRDYVGGSVFLEKRQIPQIEEVARFWRRYFKDKARQG